MHITSQETQSVEQGGVDLIHDAAVLACRFESVVTAPHEGREMYSGLRTASRIVDATTTQRQVLSLGAPKAGDGYDRLSTR